MEKIRATNIIQPTNPKARCERDLLLEEVATFLNFSLENSGKKFLILNMLKGKRPSEVRRLLSTAKQEGKNPPAYFQWLCRNKV